MGGQGNSAQSWIMLAGIAPRLELHGTVCIVLKVVEKRGKAARCVYVCTTAALRIGAFCFRAKGILGIAHLFKSCQKRVKSIADSLHSQF
jgi:hypothetical protein